MAENSIEILGQKLTYPSSWHGVAAVFCVCASVVTVSYVLDEKRIGAIGNAVAGVKSALEESEDSNEKAQKTIDYQAQEIESLTKALADLQKKSSGTVKFDPKVFEHLKFNRDKTTESLSNYLSSQNKLNEKLFDLKSECPECVSTFPTTTPPNLQIRLDTLLNQKQVLELQH